MLQAVVKNREATLPPDHPDTLLARNSLGVALDYAGHTDEAIAIHKAVLMIREAKLGPDHPDTLVSRNCLAADYRSANRTDEAIAMVEAALRFQESKPGPDHPNTLISRANLALFYADAARWTDSEALSRETLARRRRRVKPDSPLLADDLATLARSLLKQSRCAEAEPLLRECLAIRLKASPDDYGRFVAASLLGGALLGRRNHAEAEPLIVDGYEGIRARAAKISATNRYSLSEAAERVVQLYKDWGKPDRAAAWASKLGLADLPATVFAPE